MPKDKKEPGGVYIGLKKAEELGKQLEENKKAKGGLNKFMKERSGAAVTQKEADRLKKVSRAATIGSAAETMSGAAISEAEQNRLKDVIPNKNISGAAISDAERERLQDAMPDYAEGGEVVIGKGKDYIKDLL